MCVGERRQGAAGSGQERQAAAPSPSLRPNTAVEKHTAFGLDADLSADTDSPEMMPLRAQDFSDFPPNSRMLKRVHPGTSIFLSETRFQWGDSRDCSNDHAKLKSENGFVKQNRKLVDEISFRSKNFISWPQKVYRWRTPI